MQGNHRAYVARKLQLRRRPLMRFGPRLLNEILKNLNFEILNGEDGRGQQEMEKRKKDFFFFFTITDVPMLYLGCIISFLLKKLYLQHM